MAKNLHEKSKSFIGDGNYLDDGGQNLERLWKFCRWKPIKRCDGRYTCKSKDLSLIHPLQLIHQVFLSETSESTKKRESITRNVNDSGEDISSWTYSHIYFDSRPEDDTKNLSSKNDPVWAIRFIDGGGLLSYEKTDKKYVHTFNTESGLCRKLMAISAADKMVEAIQLKQRETKDDHDIIPFQEKYTLICFQIQCEVLSYICDDGERTRNAPFIVVALEKSLREIDRIIK